MPSRLVDNQIQLNSRLRAQTVSAVKRIWQALPDYNEGVLDQWFSQVLPVVLAAQRQQVALTETYLARALDRPAIGVDVEQLIGAAARGGTSPEEVYRRPFITLWSALGDRVPWADAVGYGQARAASSAAMDVQMAMRNTLQAVGEIDPDIAGFQRVADGAACDYCLMLDGAQFRTADPLPLHNFCGCSAEPIVYTRGAANRGNLDKFNETATPKGVDVQQHGELGPVITDPAQSFAPEPK